MKEYVLGFLFDIPLARVVLIEKHPQREDQQWQQGMLNGVGGGIDPGDENPKTAMCREYVEETGVPFTDWNYFGVMGGTTWRVHLFAARNDIQEPEHREREQASSYPVAEVLSGQRWSIENLPWLIALAIDFLTDGRPEFTEIRYP